MNLFDIPACVLAFLLLKKILDALEYSTRWEPYDDGIEHKDNLRSENKEVSGGDR